MAECGMEGNVELPKICCNTNYLLNKGEIDITENIVYVDLVPIGRLVKVNFNTIYVCRGNGIIQEINKVNN
mgnify:CR=1 FL=1